MCAIFASWCAIPSDTELPKPPVAEYSVAVYEEENLLNIKTWEPEDAERLAYEMADKYDLESLGLREKFVKTMRKESNGFIDPCIQSKIEGSGPNGQENSWGYPQFWLDQPMKTPSGELITKEIACDPPQALDTAAWHFSEGRAHRWSVYRDLQ